MGKKNSGGKICLEIKIDTHLGMRARHAPTSLSMRAPCCFTGDASLGYKQHVPVMGPNLMANSTHPLMARSPSQIPGPGLLSLEHPTVWDDSKAGTELLAHGR